MKVYSFLNGRPFENLSEDEKKKFSIEAQKKMLKIAGYQPTLDKDNMPGVEIKSDRDQDAE